MQMLLPNPAAKWRKAFFFLEPPQALAPALGVLASLKTPQATASACTGLGGGGGPQDPTGHCKYTYCTVSTLYQYHIDIISMSFQYDIDIIAMSREYRSYQDTQGQPWGLPWVGSCAFGGHIVSKTSFCWLRPGLFGSPRRLHDL